jgi:hypothetical protein
MGGAGLSLDKTVTGQGGTGRLLNTTERDRTAIEKIIATTVTGQWGQD